MKTVEEILAIQKNPKLIFQTLAEVGLAIMTNPDPNGDTLWLVDKNETAIEAILGALDPWFAVPEDYNGDYEVTVAYFKKVIKQTQGE